MKTKDVLINDIVTELEGLKTKIFKLETFMACADFMRVTAEQKRLLEIQYDAMQKYKTVLLQRVYNLRFEKTKEEQKHEDCTHCKCQDGELHAIHHMPQICKGCEFEGNDRTEDPCNYCNFGSRFTEKGRA